ncbi:hypothetical protein [Ornithobacterium rhinotracheale]|uniref:hypothetical protein n=1 Tax=Ornithobacterium rhinotracheale TaxID=28251 RepID=UPI001FF36530|nr:hypothetical protein [Ornithobacterium rhinotracheale]MCK0206074.1 hypothetical protein [Ornithobacterium rhinotracheale]
MNLKQMFLLYGFYPSERLSKVYYDTKISNQALAKLYPDFFANIPDTILERRRADT